MEKIALEFNKLVELSEGCPRIRLKNNKINCWMSRLTMTQFTAVGKGEDIIKEKIGVMHDPILAVFLIIVILG